MLEVNMDTSNRRFLIGVFGDDHAFLDAAHDLNDHNIEIYDCYTPFPVHGLDDYMGIKRSRLPVVTFIAGSMGLVLSLYFQYWTSAVDWPINVGGKSYNSFPAFIPVAFEITVLFGALATVIAFLFRAKLNPMQVPINPIKEVSDNKFVIAVDICNASIDDHYVEEIFSHHKAEKVYISEGSSWS